MNLKTQASPMLELNNKTSYNNTYMKYYHMPFHSNITNSILTLNLLESLRMPEVLGC
jgi:hypothetical protein